VRQALRGLRRPPPPLAAPRLLPAPACLTANVPRVEGAEHGVSQAGTPWAEPGSRFTELLEPVVIDWLKKASFAAVAWRLGLWRDEVDGIIARTVVRGLAWRGGSYPARIGLDETSFQKRHEYVTVVMDLDGKRVLSVVDAHLARFQRNRAMRSRSWR
jgi:transposase